MEDILDSGTVADIVNAKSFGLTEVVMLISSIAAIGGAFYLRAKYIKRTKNKDEIVETCCTEV